MRVLFVCLGNICRSPTAEAVLRSMSPDTFVDSAGTSDWHIGDAPYEPAINAASARGYDMRTLRARQVNVRDFYEFDLILAMDDGNLGKLLELRPKDATADVRLFLEFAPEIETAAVPDPYYTRDFDGALTLIERGMAALIEAKNLS